MIYISKIKNLIILSVVFSLFVSLAPQLSQDFVTLADSQTPEERYIVKLKDTNRHDSLKNYSNKIESLKDSSWIKINLNQKSAQKLKSDSNVLSVEKEKVRKLLVNPNDTYYSSNGSYISSIDDQWNLKKINLNPIISPPSGNSGWEITTGSSSTVIAVIDTGIDMAHPDLMANIWTNPGETGSTSNEGATPNCTSRSLILNKNCNNLDNDSNGFINDVHGWNFVDNNNNIQDVHGHGTHVAGTISAVTNNASGLAGICWNCQIMPLKVVNPQGYAYDSDIANAIRYAANNGARVINMSLGGPGYTQMMQDAINYAVTRNVLVISASGNDGASASNSYPGGFLDSMSIGATDYTDAVASFSNTGSKVDLVAPGVNVLSTKLTPASNGCVGITIYTCMSGTSMATPHVVGVAGLLVSLHPDWNLYQLRYALLNSTNHLGTSPYDLVSGFGRLNALSALQKSQLQTSSIPSVTLNTPSSFIKDTFNVIGSVNDANLYIYMISLKDSNGNIQGQWSGRANVSNNILASIDTTQFVDGTYTLTLKAEDMLGVITISSSFSTTINNATPKTFATISPVSTYLNNVSPNFSWNQTNASSPITYSLVVDNVVVANNISQNKYQMSSSLSEGSHNWYVIATTSVGKTSSSNVSNFYSDITPPSSPSPNVMVNGSNALITFASNDSGSGMSTYDLLLNGVVTPYVSSPINLNSLSDGNYNVIITAHDNASNTASSSVSFQITSRNLYLTSKADFNHDSVVDVSDLSILAVNWRQKTNMGDANGDGFVDISDLSILAQNWQHKY